jgi:dTDP-4-dehydrorhamnose 3,5-epimerase
VNFIPINLEGAYLIEPKIFKDERGMFHRFFSEDEFHEIYHKKKWVQINHSYTAKSATIRGMHYQLPPFTEIKMIKCIAGKIFDVIVDVRQNSKTFLQWAGVELSSENKRSLYIPEGFAHGFQTLTDNCELIYFHTAAYQAGHEAAMKFNDPAVNISWPLPVGLVSERDQQHPLVSKEFSGIKLN